MISIYKPIKFFLNVGENKIRSLDDLRKGSDFHLDYLYGLFKDGILERWLQIHKYTDEYNALKDLPKDELNEETAFKFCSILLPGLEDTSLQLYSNNLLFEKKWSEYLTTIKDTKNQYDKIINDYHSGFERLKTFIKRDALNMPRIKTHLEELSLK
jgi:hypothetical protein